MVVQLRLTDSETLLEMTVMEFSFFSFLLALIQALTTGDFTGLLALLGF